MQFCAKRLADKKTKQPNITKARADVIPIFSVRNYSINRFVRVKGGSDNFRNHKMGKIPYANEIET